MNHFSPTWKLHLIAGEFLNDIPAALTSMFHVFSDAHGAVLPVVAEEPTQFIRHATHSSVHGPHH